MKAKMTNDRAEQRELASNDLDMIVGGTLSGYVSQGSVGHQSLRDTLATMLRLSFPIATF